MLTTLPPFLLIGATIRLSKILHLRGTQQLDDQQSQNGLSPGDCREKTTLGHPNDAPATIKFMPTAPSQPMKTTFRQYCASDKNSVFNAKVASVLCVWPSFKKLVFFFETCTSFRMMPNKNQLVATISRITNNITILKDHQQWKIGLWMILPMLAINWVISDIVG